MESNLPPKPHSIIAISTLFSLKYLKLSAVVISKKEKFLFLKKSKYLFTNLTMKSFYFLPIYLIRSLNLKYAEKKINQLYSPTLAELMTTYDIPIPFHLFQLHEYIFYYFWLLR